MKLNLILICIIMVTMTFSAIAQQKMTAEEYIDRYYDLAVEEMKKNKIPASITLAQGILESSSGSSDLAVKANNHFGIKCHKEWNGKTYYKDDDEKDECFRKYKDPEESYRDHSAFLTSRDRYKPLFELEILDYRGWAYGLKEAGYATNPRYPELLIKIIEENGLDRFDSGRQLAVGSPQSTGTNQNSKLKTQNSELRTQNSELTFDIFARAGNDRIIFLNNGVKFIFAREGDDFYKIAGEFGIYAWQVREYNDLKSKDILQSGQKVYLEKKKARAAVDLYIAGGGETMRDISQDYGVRLRTLCRRNGKAAEDILMEGEQIRLN